MLGMPGTLGSSSDGGDGFQRHVAGALDGPFIVLLEQDRLDQPDNGVFIGEDADDLDEALDLAAEPLERIAAVELRPMLVGKLM